MFKRYFILNLIGICKHQHRIALIVLWIFTVGSQNISAQQQIALGHLRYLSTELPHLPRS